jgi:hypothetical protein
MEDPEIGFHVGKEEKENAGAPHPDINRPGIGFCKNSFEIIEPEKDPRNNNGNSQNRRKFPIFLAPNFPVR